MKSTADHMMAEIKAMGCCKGSKPNYRQTSSKPGDGSKAAMELMNIGGSANPKKRGIAGSHGNKSSYVD